MSKAVLVLPEMPKDCLECKLEKTKDYHCPINGRVINTAVRPFYCQIREMPEKCLGAYDTDYGVGYWQGWNDALRAIEGSGEDG